jgi:D-alanyl-D-alanine carboxypeptidase/D-alanyl-D-alanine-endopeptidase (penicillin-binding protein 4)
MRVFLLFIAFSISAFSLPSCAAGTSQYSALNYLPKGSRASISIRTPDGRSRLAVNTDQMFPPASTLKLITALAAKLELGDHFRFKTQAERSGNDLILRFSGDPTLTSDDLNALLGKIKAAGVNRIKGDIWLNNSAFTGYERGVGWPWDILGVCYSAPSSAVTLDKNCVQASIYTQDDGSTRVFVPEHQPIRVETEAVAVTKQGQESKQCDLELITFDSNEYLLSGCLVKRAKPLPLKFAVQETHAYTAAVIRNLLKKHGIHFNGNIELTHQRKGKLIATHLSKPLPAMLDEMLKHSDNLIADNLTKTLGSTFYLQPGSFNNGTEAIKQILFAKAGIDLSRAQLADGSGLSRNNRLTATDMMKVLDYIWAHDDQLNLLSMLPKAGESGTLRYRRSMRKAPVKGHLAAKSGTLYGSYNMAGYSVDASGAPKALFVQFVTDYYPEKNSLKKKDGATGTIPPIFQFEQAFYNDVVRYK